MRHQKSFIEDFNHTYFEQLPLWDFTVLKHKFLIVKQLKYLAFCCNYLLVHHLYLWTIGFLFVCLLVFFFCSFCCCCFFFYNKLLLSVCDELQLWAKRLKVARYSFSRSIPPKFESKLRRHKQRFGKIDTTVVLEKDETLLWSELRRHRSCHSNEMTPLPILLAAIYLGTGNCSSKIVYWSFFLQ